ncbi:MAG TPA: DUF4956 domain-containing protein [Gemmatimonadales bacterium]|nr:DUF4956 domain-containing protein [Gemmatimonadales bacterium]
MEKPSFLSWFDRQQALRVFVYYALLGVLVMALHRVAPNLPGVFTTENFAASMTDVSRGEILSTGSVAPIQKLSAVRVAGTSLLMMLGAVLLMLPVAWVHILTRSRKGFSQSMVQTLIILPIVVTGVLAIVQYSTALAFALGGVVGAVSFRNRLADPKDAIYIFVAIAVGIAAGVQVLSMAAAISIFFNLVVLSAWYFDFGRMPAMLQASVAQRRLERVKATKGGGGGGGGGGAVPGAAGAGGAPTRPSMRPEFLNLVDKQLLQSMTPDQLQAIAERASERRRKAMARQDDSEPWEKKARFDAVLRISMLNSEADTVRRLIETVLAGQTKRWVSERADPDPEHPERLAVRYMVRFAKAMPGPLVVEAIRRAALPQVVTIDVLDA